MFVYFVGVVEEYWQGHERYRFWGVEVKLPNKVTTNEELKKSLPIVRESIIAQDKEKIDKDYARTQIIDKFSKESYVDTLYKYLTILSFSLLREE